MFTTFPTLPTTYHIQSSEAHRYIIGLQERISNVNQVLIKFRKFQKINQSVDLQCPAAFYISNPDVQNFMMGHKMKMFPGAGCAQASQDQK